MARKVTKRKDGFFSIEGVEGYFREEDAKRVAAQMDKPDPSTAKADADEGEDTDTDDDTK